MDQVTLSIIVPCYNAERYIDACVKSVLTGTYTDFELLLVDDGSIGGDTYLRKYETVDSRIKVLTKPNGGVSSARNLGLQVCQGKWVTFIDADDFVKPSFLDELMHPILQCEDVQFVQGGFTNFYDNAQTDIGQDYVYRIIDTNNYADRQWTFNSFRGLVVSKIFCTQIIRNYALQFDPKIKIGEDFVFTIEYLCHINKLTFVGTTGYLYRRHSESTTKKRKADYNQRIYEFKQTYIAIKRLQSLWGISNEDARFRRQRLGYELFATASELYSSTMSRATRLNHLNSDFTPDEKESLDVDSFPNSKKVLAYLLKKGRLATYDTFMCIIFTIKRWSEKVIKS